MTDATTVPAAPDDPELAASYRYPPRWEADVVAADGGAFHLRPITPDDADAMVVFHAGLSSRTRYLRYFSAYPTIPPRDLLRFSRVNHRDRVALAAWLNNQIIAIGRYEGAQIDARPIGTAEVAFVVADAHQGRGIGSVLLEHLAEAAREVGIERFEALVLAENTKMMRVFLDAGYQPSRHFDGGEVTLEFDVASTAQTERVVAEREQHAEARSIRRLLYPSSVAVVGASADPGKIGNLVVDNLQRSGYAGELRLVNQNSSSINGIPAFSSLGEVPGQVDLVVVTVPADSFGDLVADAARRDVRGLVVISAGFGESGDAEQRRAGLHAQRRLVSEARSHGMRVVGPNCLGVLNTDPAVSLNASLATVVPLRGKAGFFCQSGALGAAVLGEAARRGLGVSTFVSAGNRADVSGNDLLQYWESDPNTDLALLYLESFGNPRKFARLARRLARQKPIVAVKSGRGSIVAGLQHSSSEIPESSVQALFEASGVIRTATLAQLFDVAVLLATQPLPAGDQVAVVGHSTALGFLVADALANEGLRLSRLVDVGIEATPAEFGDALREALAAEDVDAVVCIFVPPMRRGSEQSTAEQLRLAVAEQGRPTNDPGSPAASAKPVLSTFLGFDGVPAELAVPGELSPMRGSIPSYASPERAVAALAHVLRYSRWRSREPGRVPEIAGIDTAAARRYVSDVIDGSPAGRDLTRAEATHLLGLYGVPVVPSVEVRTLRDAVRAADLLGLPVALKAGGQGAVRLHLADAEDLDEAWHSLGLPDDDASAVVQSMSPRGIDTILELSDDRSFGSLLSFGVGGVATDLLNDRAYAVVPLTGLDASELIGGPKAFPLLTGYWDAEPADIPALVELALRLSQLADEVPEVVSCRLAPIVAAPIGAHVLEAAVRVATPMSRSDLGARRLSGL